MGKILGAVQEYSFSILIGFIFEKFCKSDKI